MESVNGQFSTNVAGAPLQNTARRKRKVESGFRWSEDRVETVGETETSLADYWLLEKTADTELVSELQTHMPNWSPSEKDICRYIRMGSRSKKVFY